VTGHVPPIVQLVFEWAALAIEVLGVTFIVAGVVMLAAQHGTVRYLTQLQDDGAYHSYKHQLAKALLIGLELMVAADVIRTVALEATLTNVSVLGLLVLIRTFLSWSLAVEIDGRWPWHAHAREAAAGTPRAGD
jgi:uncharacterized membrane protein